MQIQINEAEATERELRVDMLNVLEGTTETENGEITDPSARLIARHWARRGSALSHLSMGLLVDHTELLDDISVTARQAMGRTTIGWPRELELLSTWAINHE